MTTKVQLTITKPSSTQTITVEEDDVVLALFRTFGMAIATYPCETQAFRRRIDALAGLADALGITSQQREHRI